MQDEGLPYGEQPPGPQTLSWPADAVTDAVAPAPPVTCDVVAAARLDGVRLAAREIAHLLNNDLAVSVGALDLLRHCEDLPPALHDLVERALAGISAATAHVERLQRVQRVVTHETPAGPSLDLDHSG
ncbi:MAG: hypothetical protein IT306_21570 [Chloroflexi bacterium]|nr:hypothetical protein [Chloroflexota bacterium]